MKSINEFINENISFKHSTSTPSKDIQMDMKYWVEGGIMKMDSNNKPQVLKDKEAVEFIKNELNNIEKEIN